ncbi:MAG: GNAT family N-acetyltransferase [Erysipelotrichaceae bacterium]|nr:GNAT family N-acetyltransferase [Erysipelotrichaceae bacterium]
MITKTDLSRIILKKDDLVIRRITESDRDTFAQYTSLEYFDEAIKADDTLGVFMDDEMVGAFVSYGHSSNERIAKENMHGTALGFSCKKSQRNKGIISSALKALSDHLLKELDYVFLEITKDNIASQHVADNAGFSKYDKDEEIDYYIKCHI